MENALLYTLSTIAQSLASAGALFAALALYKAQSLDTMARVATRDLRRRHPTDEQLATLEAEGDYGSFITWYTELERDLTVAALGADAFVQFNCLKVSVQSSRTLRALLTKSLVATGIVIFMSIVLLTTVPTLKGHETLSAVALLSGLAGTGWCLLTYKSIINVALFGEEPV